MRAIHMLARITHGHRGVLGGGGLRLGVYGRRELREGVTGGGYGGVTP